MFWSLGHFTSPSIDTILDREAGFTLEELLEEDELLQECKGQNTKLTDFLTQPETLDKLVRYVTDMPSADDTEARRYKYPFVASEVLACDIPVLRDAIFAAPSLLQQLLSLLQQPPPLAPVLAGYVVKVVTALQKQGPDAFTKFFEDANGISVDTLLPQLVKHIGSDSILQLLINLCVGEPPAAEPGGPQGLPSSREDLAAASWLPHDRLIPAVIDALGAEGDDGAESAANASALLCALLAASTEPPYCLEEPEGGAARCAALVRVCLGDDISGPPNLPAMEMVLQLLGKLRDSQSSSPVLSSLLDAVEVDVERFFAALAAPTPLPARIARFLPTDGLAYRPRGQQRCKLLLLMEECLKSERPALIQPLIELGLFHIVIDLLLLPHSCNALHMRASAILEWAVATTCEHASAIHQSLFVEATLAQRLLLLVAEYTPPPPPPPPADGDTQPPPPPPKRKTLPCCHAFVMHIGACLLSAAQREPDVRELLERVDGWDAFISPGGALTTWEALQSKPLGGLAPTRCDDESDDDDEIDATTMERVLAAQAAASRGDHSLDSNQDDEDDEEGGAAPKDHQTLLHAAIQTGNVELVRLLVTHGAADVSQNMVFTSGGRYYLMSALQLAKEMGHADIAEVLAAAGAQEEVSADLFDTVGNFYKFGGWDKNSMNYREGGEGKWVARQPKDDDESEGKRGGGKKKGKARAASPAKAKGAKGKGKKKK